MQRVTSFICFVVLAVPPAAWADAISELAISSYNTLESTYNIDLYVGGGNGANLGWGESYILMGANAMYEATGQNRYLQRTLDHADSVMANRSDRLGITDAIRGRLMPAWNSTRYTNGSSYAWEVHAGMVCAPIARASYLVKTDPALKALYGARADRYIRDMTDMAIGFESDWSAGPKSGEGHYSEYYLNATSPYNQMNALGRTYVSLYLATGQSRFRERAEQLARFLKDDLRTVGDRYDWAYSTSSSGSEDISHAAINVDFAFECYRAGIVFTAADMQKFANTLKACSRGVDGATGTVSGSGSLYATPGLLGMWGHLGYIDPSARTELFKYYSANPTIGGVTWGTAVSGYLAETAKPFAMQSVLPQASQRKALVPIERGNNYLVPGGLGPRGSGYLSGGTLYDDTVAKQGQSSLRIEVTDSPTASGGWMAEVPFLTTRGSPLIIDRAGYVGIWLKTRSLGVLASLLVSDFNLSEQSAALSLVPDDQWHLYQWNLDDPAQWNGLAGGTGALEGLAITLESLLFSGPDSSSPAILYADMFEADVSAPLPEPTAALMGLAGALLIRRSRTAF